MDSSEVARLERELRITKRKLERSEISRRKLELDIDNTTTVYRRVIGELRRKKAALKESEAAALQASRLKSEFLANMSHEIRTPMHGLLGMADLLHRSELGGRSHELAGQLLRSATTLMQLIDDVLDFSKIEAGRLELETVEFDLVELVEDAAMLFGPAARASGVALLCEVPPIPALRGDPVRLRQVITNLVSNAVKFTADGSVRLAATAEVGPDAAQISIEVSDTGIGFDPTLTKLIFEPFSQADGTTTRRYGGTGLGLSIVKELVELMGGRIHAESTPDRGSTFHVSLELPLARPGQSRPLPLDGVAVDLVCAHELQRASVQRTLERLGARVNPFDSVPASPLTPFVLLDGTCPTNVASVRALYDRVVVLTGPSTPIEGLQRQGVDARVGVPPRHVELVDALAEAPPSQGEEPSGSTRPSAPTGLTVLIAEDNPINREVAVVSLQTLGCTVVAVEHGADAVASAREQVFDLVLLDCQMPVMDGFAAAERIRQDTPNRNRPIVALTANVLARDRERCLSAGMDDVVSKPYTIAQLSSVLRRWANRCVPSRGTDR